MYGILLNKTIIFYAFYILYRIRFTNKTIANLTVGSVIAKMGFVLQPASLDSRISSDLISYWDKRGVFKARVVSYDYFSVDSL